MILIACDACHRQYDVTALAPASRVRCACDALLAVPARAPLPADALRCGHCGAPAGADHAQCTFCGAELDAERRRETTLCPRCLTRLRDDARHCSGCAMEIRPQVLTALPADARCPRCAGELAVRALEGAHVVECTACHGLWLRPEGFAATCAAAERDAGGLDDVRRPAPPSRPPGASDVRYVPCVTCGELMQRQQYRFRGSGSGVVIDRCGEHGVWLDAHELERVTAFVRRQVASGATAPGVDPELPPEAARELALAEVRFQRKWGKPRASGVSGPALVGTSFGELLASLLVDVLTGGW